MEVLRVQANISFHGKSKPIAEGFRPTLSFSGKKALCNIEHVEPSPLFPAEDGRAIIAIAWAWPEPCPIRVGDSFLALEGEKEVGRGIVIRVVESTPAMEPS